MMGRAEADRCGYNASIFYTKLYNTKCKHTERTDVSGMPTTAVL